MFCLHSFFVVREMSSVCRVGSGANGGAAATGERRGSMSDQPLLCKPALEREVTESLKIVNPDFAPHLSNSRSSTTSLPYTSTRRVIKSSGRNYGSFTNTACTDSFFQHRVQSGETLQGDFSSMLRLFSVPPSPFFGKSVKI